MLTNTITLPPTIWVLFVDPVVTFPDSLPTMTTLAFLSPQFNSVYT